MKNEGRNTTGVIFTPNSEQDMIKIQHWLISRDVKYVTRRIESTRSKDDQIIMCNLSLKDRLLYTLSFGFKKEKVKVFS